MWNAALWLTLLLLPVAWAPGAEAAARARPARTPLAAVLEGYARQAREAYAGAARELGSLRLAVQALLASPSPESLEQAREAWRASRAAYARTEVFRFSGGPIDDVHPVTGAQGPEGRINAWPIDEAYLDHVVGDAGVGLIQDLSVAIAESTLVERNAAEDETQVTLGYHAIEFLLWGQDTSRVHAGNRPSADYRSGDPIRERRGATLALLVDLLHRDVSHVADEWVPGPGRYVDVFRALPPAEALGRALSGPATMAAFELASERIGIPLSTGMQEDEESCFSDNTLRDLAENIAGIAAVLEGDRRTPGLLAALEPARGREIRAALARARRLVASVPPPFDAILGAPEEDPRRRTLQALAGELLMLAGALQRAGETAGARAVIGGGG
jgi:putative iron-regulated protein